MIKKYNLAAFNNGKKNKQKAIKSRKKAEEKKQTTLKMNNVKCQRKKAVKNNFSGISYSGKIM